jgi:hypothetical protein
VLSCEEHGYWIKDSSWKVNGIRQAFSRMSWMDDAYIDFERGVSVSFVFLEGLGCQPGAP